MKQLLVVGSLIIIVLTRIQCAPSLNLTTEPVSMGSFCPRPVNITCNGTEISTTFLWKNGSVELVNYGYQSSHNGSFPRPLSLLVPLQGVTAEVFIATPSTSNRAAIDIVSTLFIEDVSVLNGSSIFCEGGLGARSEEFDISVQFQGPPNITSSVTVISTYTSSAESAELNEVLVQWKHVGQPMISEDCLFNEELNYTVVLEDNGTIIEQRIISSDSCVNDFCETSFVSTSSNSYVVQVTATNGIGLSSGTVESSTIERTIPFNFDVTFANCETSVLCSYNSMGYCSVQFTQNPDYQDLSEETLGRLNSPFLLLLMEPTTTFYYQATVTINSSTTIQIRRSFTTGEFDVRLTSANLALLVLGVILLFVAIAGCFVLVVVQVRSDKGFRLSLVMLVMVVVVIIVFSLVLWVAAILQFLLQSNTCDSTWQGTRDNLIIAAFVFSLLALLSLASAAMVLALAFNGKRRSNKDLDHKEGWEIQLYQHKDEIERDEIARRVKILEAPEVKVDEFKYRGEKFDQATARTGERLFQEYDSKVNELQYAALKHNTPPVNVAAPNPTYSKLDTPEGKDTMEYSTFNHEQDKRKSSNGKGTTSRSKLPPTASTYDVAYPNTSEKVDVQDVEAAVSSPSEPSEEFKPPCVTMCKYSIFLLAGSKTPSPEEVRKVGEQVAAWFPSERKWSVEDLGADKRLKVYFDSKSGVISNEFIMELLEDSWKGCFIAHLNKKDCNIRVTFQDSSADGSWSALGCEAKHTPKSKPTMVLNFKAMNEDEVKTTVIHQFGHALGLGHALMKPNKWEVLKPHLKIDEMMRSYGSPNIDSFEVQWTGKNMNKEDVNYDPGSIMHSRYSTNPEWLKVQNEKLSSDAQKQISIFKKHSTPQNQLSKNDLKVLDFEVIRPAFTLKDLESLENKASNETFHLTAKLATSWRTVGENLGLATDILEQIGDSKSTDEGMLTAVWSKWFNHPENFSEYPLTRKGLRKLLESCDKETAKHFFVFLDNKVC